MRNFLFHMPIAKFQKKSVSYVYNIFIKMGNCQQTQVNMDGSQEFFSQCRKISKNEKFACFKFQDTSIKNNKAYILSEKQADRKGIIFIPNLFYYEGQISEDNPQGQGQIRWFENGQQINDWPLYNGYFSKGLAQGDGVYISNTYIFQGKWAKGYPIEGVYTAKRSSKKNIQYKIKDLKIEGKYNYLKGSAQIKLPNGSTYIGDIEKFNNNFCFHGNGKMIFKNGDIYEGNWKAGMMDGKGKYTWNSSGKIYEGMYKDGCKNGFGKMSNKQKEWQINQWKNGVKVESMGDEETHKMKRNK